MSLKEQVLAGVRWSGGSQLAVALLQLVQLGLLALLLAPSDFGLIAMVMAVAGLSRESGSGMEMISSRDLSEPKNS